MRRSKKKGMSMEELERKMYGPKFKFDSENYGMVSIGRRIVNAMHEICEKHKQEGCPICRSREPILVPVKHLSRAELEEMYPAQPGEHYELKVSDMPHIMDPTVRVNPTDPKNTEAARVLSAILNAANDFYGGMEWDNMEIRTLRALATGGIVMNRINLRDFYKRPSQDELNTRRRRALDNLWWDALGGGGTNKPPTRWENLKWRLEWCWLHKGIEIAGRIRDAWLVLIGKRDVVE